ncbi:uncharacterized protein LOC122037022 isoform X1 [Zingiber officinale]|uniref:uncharacterized protein LOC122037022 isoform X1 n=1 Tax=Zingiber officinale TaxID=94328 RepID=UPI001C4DC970|nr:uncharacterized protein LOC122037022 isoform X1 [Zingiber officinale]XP_042452401.1 uncharacterized protein LOC122037022 isoform X1 [Zingiber officinale]XP_042452402.1 uncharacterized protein LOC122037022 isoform X1 [Zingiber officinale]XP_042452403.1 uncharacterized protein LOC122037022 isoform X1 [Zingiber officinale]XP_042452404.1 uncharacterized protein LOC122037022 isoform X1 [Zingiber officinale]
MTDDQNAQLPSSPTPRTTSFIIKVLICPQSMSNWSSMSKMQMDNGSSWGPLRSLFSYRYRQELKRKSNNKKKNWKKIGCSGSLCRMRDSSSVISPAAVVKSSEANNKLASDSSCNSSSRSLKAPSDGITGAISTSFSSNSSSSVTASSSSASSSLEGSFGAMHLRGVSGCYECRDIFMTPDDLELHQIQKHAVSEMGVQDSSRKIIELIFLSSWLKKQAPIPNIERVLKVQNTPTTTSRFEAYRDFIRDKANKPPLKHSRCIADGNELLRFYCTSVGCSVGLHGAPTLCQSASLCSLCGILRDGFKVDELGKTQTMATSFGAHGACTHQVPSNGGMRAMLVSRVIAGRVKQSQSDDDGGEYDSVSSSDELSVFSPSAILPCFVVLYRGV